MTEKQKYRKALKPFLAEMKNRFDKKTDIDNWEGWDYESYYIRMASRMMDKAGIVVYGADKKNHDKHLIDIANFALFLYTIRNPIKEK